MNIYIYSKYICCITYILYIYYIYTYTIYSCRIHIYIYICIQVLRISVYLKTLCIYIYKRSYIILPNDISTVYRHKISFSQVFESIKVESMIDW